MPKRTADGHVGHFTHPAPTAVLEIPPPRRSDRTAGTIVTTNNIAVLVPAHNEEECITQTLKSISRQTIRPALVALVLNNSTDATIARINEYRALDPNLNIHLIMMPRNPDRKAGALNFGYRYVRDVHPHIRFIVQMDADSILHERFIELTYTSLQQRRNAGVAAVSSAFVGRFGIARTRYQRCLMVPQRMEYTRYQDTMQSSSVSVISGTGNMLRVEALDELLRDPGRGAVWRTDSLVEDYELTLALRARQWDCRKSRRFVVYTDLMPSVRALWRQRLRWQRGTFDELRRYGWSEVTRVDWLKQITHGGLMLLHIGGVGLLFYALGRAASSDSDLSIHPIVALFLLSIAGKQAYHVRSLGWRHILVSLILIPEEIYNFMRHGWWLRGLYLSLRNTKQSW